MNANGGIAGVVGAGSFGTTVAKLLAHNSRVLLFTRSREVADKINNNHFHLGYKLSENIRATTRLEEISQSCDVVFPVIPSANFRNLMQTLGKLLEPRHIVIHATKGFDLTGVKEKDKSNAPISRNEVRTMSEVIIETSPVLRVGCLSGPNLAKEILEGQPTATVVASEFSEVIQAGQKLLSSDVFFVFGSHDLIGAELAGALKNVIALGSGYLNGQGLGKNIQAMLITRGLHEIVYFGKSLGAKKEAFLGTAGIGDLIATGTSEDSRNFTFGKMLGTGKTIQEAEENMVEVAEGVRTLKIAYRLSKYYNIKVPITEMLFKVIYEGFPFEKALEYLMRYPYTTDVDFL
jgi:glycerol-3-phosphate dehydrogenase (NAD(P)+)